MKSLFAFVLLLCVALPHLSRADSPLTSTDFCAAYQQEAIVIQAREAKGVLTPELLAYLMHKKKPIALKMAVINQLGWNFDGKKNAEIFMEAVKAKHGYANLQDFKARGRADLLLCMAYLKSLDDYFNVTEAVSIAEAALRKNDKSYTFQLITALIKAQQAFDSDWCKVFQLTDAVRKMEGLKADLNDEASRIIFDYMDLYRSSCDSEK